MAKSAKPARHRPPIPAKKAEYQPRSVSQRLQGMYIYKDHLGWHADILLCDGRDIFMFGTRGDYPRTRHGAYLYAESLLHIALAHEQNKVEDCRTADRFDWQMIWKEVLIELSAYAQANAQYPLTTPLTVKSLDEENDYHFVLKIDAPVPEHFIRLAKAVWNSKRDTANAIRLVLPINDGSAAIAMLGFCLLVCDFTDPDRKVLHLKFLHLRMPRKK